MSLKRLQQDPEAFRQAINIRCDGRSVRLGTVLDPWQDADFRAIDPAWCRVAGVSTGESAKLRAWLERPRGHSKSSDLGVMACWALFASRQRIEGIASAADQDQARLLRDAMRRIVEANGWLGQIIDIQANTVVNKHTGSRLQIITSDAMSSFGHLVDFVICDEVSHWAKPDLWYSLLSTAAKKPNCLLLCISNAGWVDTWQWQLRESVRIDAGWYFSRLDGSVASWIDAERLDEQRRLLPDSVYRRLWLNQWADGAGDAIESELIASALTLPGEVLTAERGWAYVAGLDIGIRRDASALVVLGKHVGWTDRRQKSVPNLPTTVRALVDLDLIKGPTQSGVEYVHHPGTGRIKLVAVRIWKPTKESFVELESVESEILKLCERLPLSRISVDWWQAEALIQSLRKRSIPAEGVQFSGGLMMQDLAAGVLDAFRERRIDLYEHSELLADLRSLRIVEKSYGFRLESPKNRSDGAGTVHGDTATALAIAIRATKHIQHAEAFRQRSLVLSNGAA